MIDQMTLEAAFADAQLAVREYDGALAWLDRAREAPMEPLSAEVWVTDPSFSHVLLVKHRVRGWVPPGGKVEPGETPRGAARRELGEETGLKGELLALPAAVAVRSYRADWSATLGLSYAAVVDREVPLAGENGQPPRWFGLDETWESVFPSDRDRIRTHVRLLAAGQTLTSH
ncbi:NUDIX hydrolase [Streptomyces sp. 3211]|uniref:NUDIX hydrolase n=1 Tax=Streptomyces sp. 3211 TaxID=1964449 RepID=UPI00183691DB|nr:NUDIX domain-containing protein [Streptomyces sp. 3211]